MKILRPFLLFVSIVLFGWLFMSNADLINIAATLNDAENNSEITQINSFTNIDKLKGYAIQKINSIATDREEHSENAISRTLVILILALIQIVLYASKTNFSNSKTADF